MPDHTPNMLAAAARAMDEVIRPAIDPDQPLAQEQARIVSSVLAFVEGRWAWSHARHVFELRHMIDVVAELQPHAEQVSSGLAAEFAAGRAAAIAVLDDPEAGAALLQSRARELATLVTALVRTIGTRDDEPAQQVTWIVLRSSQAFLEAQRAWFAPTGWEAHPEELPSLREIYAAGGAD